VSALTGDTSGALVSAARWRLAALLLSRPRPGWCEEVEALAREAGGDEALEAAAGAAGDAREGAYHALLGAGGVASPREAAHAGFLDPGRILADLAACYAAFGFATRAEEPDDHLAVECDFVAYLFLKEAFALARGQQEAAAVTRELRDRFVAEHVAVAGHGLAAKLPEGAPGHLAGVARWLAERLPPPPSARGARLPGAAALDDGCPMDCGPCPG
jgi:hypothetical protein